jgi:hypothetical protein
MMMTMRRVKTTQGACQATLPTSWLALDNHDEDKLLEGDVHSAWV